MAEIDIFINAAPVAVSVSAAQGPATEGGGSGVSTFAALTDKATADLPAINAPLSLALAGKQASGSYVADNDARLTDARPASDVSAWAKAGTKPSYTAVEVGAAAVAHNHDGDYATADQGAKADSALQQVAALAAVSVLNETAYTALTPKVSTTLYVVIPD
jgi:hypothetical protein